MKKILLVLVSLCLFFCFSCADMSIAKDDTPNQNAGQEIEDNTQPGDKENLGGNTNDNQAPDDSDNVEQSGGVSGTPVPPIQNGGDFKFD